MNSFKKLERIVDDYARAYNYHYDEASDKNYEVNKNNITFNINSTSDESLVEIVSLGYNLLQELGIECHVQMPESNATKVLDYLEVVCEYGDSYEYYSDGETLGSISINEGITLKLDSDILLGYLEDDEETLEVSIIAKSEEELFKAMVIMQDLRLSGVITDLNKEGAKINIILNDEKLSKGLITIKDMLINEENLVPEDEVLEYILGII